MKLILVLEVKTNIIILYLLNLIGYQYTIHMYYAQYSLSVSEFIQLVNPIKYKPITQIQNY